MPTWTGFLFEYTHVGQLVPGVEQLALSVAALLVARACNAGFAAVAKCEVAALIDHQLSHVEANYLRAETYTHAAIPVTGLSSLVLSVPVLSLLRNGGTQQFVADVKSLRRSAQEHP